VCFFFFWMYYTMLCYELGWFGLRWVRVGVDLSQRPWMCRGTRKVGNAQRQIRYTRGYLY
jgi:hypothetical protein